MKQKAKNASWLWLLDPMEVASAKPYFLRYLEACQETRQAEIKAEYFKKLYEQQMNIHGGAYETEDSSG